MPKLPEGYRIETVYGRLSRPLAAEIVRFWLQQGVIPGIEEARRRVSQVVDVIRNAQGEIVGLNSVYPASYRVKQDIYLFYRLFIRAIDRKPGLARFATEHVALALKSRPEVRPGIKGLIAVTENPKLTREAARRQLKRIGFEYDGRGPKGYDIWRMDFVEGAPLSTPLPSPPVGEAF
jgi:hypothetical protein